MAETSQVIKCSKSEKERTSEVKRDYEGDSADKTDENERQTK